MQSADATATYWVIKAFNMSIFPVCKIMSGMLIESLRNYKKYLINMSSWKKAQGQIVTVSLIPQDFTGIWFLSVPVPRVRIWYG